MGIVENTYAELKQQELKNNPYSCLHMADIDINPHQIEAFTFALSSLELGGAILADEVGLGKTIEAGLVIKYLLCSGKNKILLIMPSNLRKQWQVELEEKFDIDSLIVDSSNWEDYLAKVKSKQAVIIVSYHFASKRKAEFGKIAWDFCVFDEAHRLRNVYKNGSKMANSLYELTKGIPKILLTATPMQNTLLDIYGLVQFIDDRVFYSKQIFSERYLRGEDYNNLKACLEPVVQRTLRKEVAEYIQFSERKEMTIDFELSPMEIELYVMINNYLKKEILYASPNSHRTLITSVIRKLLASSSMAVAETFKVLKGRLETLKETTRTESADESIDFFLSFFDDDEIETDDDSKQDELYTREKVNEFIQHEIDEVTAIINKAESIKRNAKMTALKQAVEKAFAFQDEAGIKQRIVVFTESIRTQQYMFEELSHAGYEGQILKFNGCINDPARRIMSGAMQKEKFSGLCCSGNHPHRPGAKAKICKKSVIPSQRGASNVYFTVTRNAISIPPWTNPINDIMGAQRATIETLVEAMGEEAGLSFAYQKYFGDKYSYEDFKAAYDRLSQNIKEFTELKEMEYAAITHHEDVEYQHDVKYFKAEEVALSESLKEYISRIIKIHRLREVRVLTGFTRLEAPEPEVDEQSHIVKLKCSSGEKWLPAVEINGEGVFIELNKEKINQWMQIETVKSRSDKYEECYAAYCQKKGWENFKPRNAEYVLLHTLSHMLIKEMSMQSGYSSSALHERIYSSENMCGILIYTGAADKEGSLGGLVELGEMNKFLPLLKGALENGLTCTTDPECFMKNPTSERLNGAACHSCTMISETACENGNRLLDRALVVPVPEHEEMGYFRELVRDLCGIQV